MSLRTQCESARHCHAPCMADAEPPGGNSQHGGRPRRAAREPDLWRGAWRALDHHIGEGDACPEAGAERLEHRFLGGEPPRQAFDPIGAIADLVKFGLNKATRN